MTIEKGPSTGSKLGQEDKAPTQEEVMKQIVKEAEHPVIKIEAPPTEGFTGLTEDATEKLNR